MALRKLAARGRLERFRVSAMRIVDDLQPFNPTTDESKVLFIAPVLLRELLTAWKDTIQEIHFDGPMVNFDKPECSSSGGGGGEESLGISCCVPSTPCSFDPTDA